jgi:hypothetical protein
MPTQWTFLRRGEKGPSLDWHRAIQSRNRRPDNSGAGLLAVPHKRPEPGLPRVRGSVRRLTVPAEISTRHDEVVTPCQGQFLTGPGWQAANITIQDKWPADVIEHDQTPNDPVVQQLVANALGVPNGPADPAFRPSCV